MKIHMTIGSILCIFVAIIVIHAFHRGFAIHAWVPTTVFPNIVFELIWNFFVSIVYSFVVLGVVSFSLMLSEYLE